MHDDDVRSLVQTVGGAALGIGLGLAILALGFVVSRVTLADKALDSSTTAATVAPLSSLPVRSAGAPTPVVSPTPPSPIPTLTPDPMIVTAFRGQGLALAAISIPAGYTLTAPVAGRIKIELYQYVNGDVRQGVTDQPSYPYVYVTSADREIKLRPGLLDTDVQLLVKDGDTVAMGAPLFKTLTTGPSSWHTFYDSANSAQVVASATAGGTGIDPVPFFRK